MSNTARKAFNEPPPWLDYDIGKATIRVGDRQWLLIYANLQILKNHQAENDQWYPTWFINLLIHALKSKPSDTQVKDIL